MYQDHSKSHEFLILDDSSDSNSNQSQDHSINAADSRDRRGLKELNNQNLKFLENFNPEQSNRERKKLLRRIKNGGSVTITEINQNYERPEIDVCDCLDTNCSGCFFPCPKCLSLKCGPECRINRKGMFDYIEVEGRSESITNSYK